jgi:hypothetical protein
MQNEKISNPFEGWRFFKIIGKERRKEHRSAVLLRHSLQILW